MKNCFKILFLILICVSCKQQISQQDIAKLNGYWEIEKVVLSNGTKKDYAINETIDFFEITNNVGFRKKVTPQFNGKYLINDVSEKIKIIKIDDINFVEYKTSYSNWKEEIVALTNEELVLKNDSNVVYYYKKPTAFSIK